MRSEQEWKTIKSDILRKFSSDCPVFAINNAADSRETDND